MTRLAMWSGPRNISTAMMRAWENRPDCEVVDEPLYGYYLARTGIEHPAREEVLATMPADLETVVADLLAPLPEGVISYQKHMTHHLLAETDRTWIGSLRNVLLIRDPREVVASYVRSRSHVEPADIGIHQQMQLLSQLGPDTPVVDAGDFLDDPETHLRWLCDWLGVDFTPAMLSWPPGPRDSDGVWAPHWYDAVRRSTGFQPRPAHEVHLEGPAADVAADCADDYALLREHRLRL